MKISCRICRIQKGEFFTLDSIICIYGQKETLLGVYNKCLQLNAALQDALPQVICLACFGTLKDYFEFQLKAKKSDQELRGNLATSTHEEEIEYLENHNVPNLINSEIEIKADIESITTEDELDYIEENYETEENSGDDEQQEPEDTDILFELYSKNDSCIEKYLKFEQQYSEEIIVEENDDKDIIELTLNPLKNNNLPLKTERCDEFIAEEGYDEKNDNEVKINLSGNRNEPLKSESYHEFDTTFKSALPSVEISRIDVSATQVNTVVLEPLVEIRKWECSDCGRKYLTKEKLEQHRKMHTQIENCQCKICGLILQSLYDYGVHMKGHPTERKFSCQFCEKAFSTRANLKTHLLIHTNLRPFKCEICGKAFQQKSILKTHMTLHTGKPFECTLCHRRFSRTAHLNIHMRQHNNIRPYQCSQCNRSYMQKSHLDRHISSTHLGVRYQCTLCNKMYTKKPSLNTHMREAHCGSVSTYFCDICDLEFSKQKGLYYHLKSKHPEYRKNSIKI